MKTDNIPAGPKKHPEKEFIKPAGTGAKRPGAKHKKRGGRRNGPGAFSATEKADVMPAMDVDVPAIQIVVQAPRNVSDAPLIALIGKIKKSDEQFQTKKINGKEVLIVQLDNGGVLILGKSSWAVADDERSEAKYSGDSYMDLLKEMKSMDSAYARAVRHIIFVDKKF